MASISPSSSSMTGSEVADGFALPAVKSSVIRQEIVRVWLRSALRHTGARCLRHRSRPDDPPPLCARRAAWEDEMSRHAGYRLPRKRRRWPVRFKLDRLCSLMAERRTCSLGGGGHWSDLTGDGKAWH